MRLNPLVLLAVFLVCAQVGAAVELKPETIQAFDRYIAALETRLDLRFHGNHFLWLDDISGLREQVLQGTVLVRPASGNGLAAVKGGRVLGLNDDIASRWGPRIVVLLSEVAAEMKAHPVGGSSS